MLARALGTLFLVSLVIDREKVFIFPKKVLSENCIEGTHGVGLKLILGTCCVDLIVDSFHFF
jgi:hypothetical protein